MRRLPAFVFFLLLAVTANQVAAAGEIEWRLENPFRLFKNPEDTELHRQIFASLSSSEQRTPISVAERKLAERYGGHGWAEAIFNDTCYDQDADRYTACPDYVLPKSHRIVARLSQDGGFWDPFAQVNAATSCQWRLTDTSGAVIARKTADCQARVTFDIPYPAGGRLSVARWSSTSETAADIKIQDLLIVGMGDSFGAGEGNPDYPVRFNDARSHDYGQIELASTGDKKSLSGYPARSGGWKSFTSSGFRDQRARWWDRECHRSLYSHQLRAALQLAIENPQRAVTFLSFSCSGAEIVQGMLLDTPVRECTPGEHFSVPGQISALSRELCRSVKKNAQMPAAIIQRMPELRNIADSEMRITRCLMSVDSGRQQPKLKRPIDLVFLSIGGNDVGFVPLIADSILSGASIYRVLGQQLGSVYGVKKARTRLDLLKKRLDGLKYAMELLLNVSKNTKVILTGYPNIGYNADGTHSCGGTNGMEVFPALQLDASKIGKAEAFLSDLNKALAAFAGRNWTFVYGFREDFRSHSLCATAGESPGETLSFPRLENGVWSPYKPSLYPAYVSRQRWFRTPNDAFLTAHMHAETVSSFGSQCSGLFSGALKTLARRHWPPFQLFLASTYGGAFHPTAEGQASIADEVVSTARTFLDATN